MKVQWKPKLTDRAILTLPAAAKLAGMSIRNFRRHMEGLTFPIGEKHLFVTGKVYNKWARRMIKEGSL